MSKDSSASTWLTRRLPLLRIDEGMWTRISFSKAEYVTPVPDEIQDDFNILRARRLVTQTRLLFVALMITIPAVMYGGSPDAPYWARVVLPAIIGIFLLLGLLNILPVKADKIDAIWAKKFIFDTTWSTPVTATLCSIWCVMSWWYAAPEIRTYYPLILSMGSLATAYCLTSIRAAAILNMAIGIVPIALLMLFTGNRMDMVAAVSLLVAAAFLLRIIVDQHQQWTELLMLQYEIRQQANTDSLTGLKNRRALEQTMQQFIDAEEKHSFALGLLDLDGFKPVNDRYGHGIGDELLCAIAERLTKVAGEDAHVARIGGDEFAILLPYGSETAHADLNDLLLTELVTPFKLQGNNIPVGASVGMAMWPHDGLTIKALMEKADKALYAVKNKRKEELAAAKAEAS